MDPATLHNEAQQLVRQGRYQDALERFQQAAAAFEARGDVANSLICRCDAGQMLSLQGKYEEAERALRDADAEAHKLDDPMPRANAAMSLGHLAAQRGDWRGSLPHLTRSFDRLFAMLAANRWPDAVGNVMEAYAEIFNAGLWASERCAAAGRSWWTRLGAAVRRWLGHSIESADPLCLGLAFVDGSKCVAIRRACAGTGEGRQASGKLPGKRPRRTGDAFSRGSQPRRPRSRQAGGGPRCAGCGVSQAAEPR